MKLKRWLPQTKRCWQGRWLRGAALTCLTLVALIVLFNIWVDWSGAREWKATQATLAKEGQTLDFRAICPDPIPDADNFCAVPILKDIALVVDGDYKKGEPAQKRARLRAACLPYTGKTTGPPIIAGATLGQRTDLKQWSVWLNNGRSSPTGDLGGGAREVIAALATQDAVREELAGGLARTRSQWTPPWKTRDLPRDMVDIPLPHHGALPGLIRALALRSIAAARAGDAVTAHECLQIIARLDQACLEEPFSNSVYVSASVAEILADAAWELCDARAGTAEDFRQLQLALAGMDFRQASWRAATSDLIEGMDAMRLAKEKPERFLQIISWVDLYPPLVRYADLFNKVALRAMPAGFFDATAALLADREFVYLIKPIQNGGWPAALAAARQFHNEAQRMNVNIVTHPCNRVAAMRAAGIGYFIPRMIYAQTLVNQAMIACALERRRIERGSYPDSLDDLRRTDGKPLPVELLTGKPMSYRKTPNGRYALWSGAFSGTNHGGQRALNKEEPNRTKFYREDYAGDWVWDFPEKSGNILSQSEVPRARIVR